MLKFLLIISAISIVASVLPITAFSAQTAKQVSVLMPKPTFKKKLEKMAEIQKRYGRVISRISRQYGVDEKLVVAIIYVESRGNADECSDAGACGLMQIMPETAEDLGFSHQDRFDPKKNIEMGVKYLSQLRSRYKFNRHESLFAYNAGPGTANRRIQKGYDAQKWPYAQKVLKTMAMM